VPIRDNQLRLLSTLSIHVPVQRHDLEGITSFLDTLKAAALKLEELARE